MGRTTAQRTNREGFVKPGELVELHRSSGLSLHDRRVFNVLIENAWFEIGGDTPHEIEMWRLRGARHESGDRVADSIRRLMTTVVAVPARDRHGAPAMMETTLLSEATRTLDEAGDKGIVVYAFSKALRRIINDSCYWGRIKAIVMFAFASKYSLALYEAVCLRAHLRTSHQKIGLGDFREMMGIKPGTLEGFPQLKQKVVTTALREVNALSDFNVQLEPIRQGGMQRGKLVGFWLHWEEKSREEWRAVVDELLRSRTGRGTRISKTPGAR